MLRMLRLCLCASILALISTLSEVAKAIHYSTYFLDDSPEIHLSKGIKSVSKLIGFKKNTFSRKQNATFSSEVILEDSKGVVVTIVSKLYSSNHAPSDEIVLESSLTNLTFNTQDLLNEGTTHIEFGDHLKISYKVQVPIHSKVTFVLTTFGTGRCNNIEEFRCRNRLCIWRELSCDEVNNCGDGSDEDIQPIGHCDIELSFEFPGVITIIIISLILVFLVSLICFFMMNNWHKKNNSGVISSNPGTTQPDVDQNNTNQLVSSDSPQPGTFSAPLGVHTDQVPSTAEDQNANDHVAGSPPHGSKSESSHQKHGETHFGNRRLTSPD